MVMMLLLEKYENFRSCSSGSRRCGTLSAEVNLVIYLEGFMDHGARMLPYALRMSGNFSLMPVVAPAHRPSGILPESTLADW